MTTTCPARLSSICLLRCCSWRPPVPPVSHLSVSRNAVHDAHLSRPSLTYLSPAMLFMTTTCPARLSPICLLRCCSWPPPVLPVSHLSVLRCCSWRPPVPPVSHLSVSRNAVHDAHLSRPSLTYLSPAMLFMMTTCPARLSPICPAVHDDHLSCPSLTYLSCDAVHDHHLSRPSLTYLSCCSWWPPVLPVSHLSVLLFMTTTCPARLSPICPAMLFMMTTCPARLSPICPAVHDDHLSCPSLTYLSCCSWPPPVPPISHLSFLRCCSWPPPVLPVSPSCVAGRPSSAISHRARSTPTSDGRPPSPCPPLGRAASGPRYWRECRPKTRCDVDSSSLITHVSRCIKRRVYDQITPKITETFRRIYVYLIKLTLN